ncbi:MAG: DNA repair protein RadC [Longicatena sp.]
MKVKELNEKERPREKALQFGIQSLSNREVIALLLRTGSKKGSALELADEVLSAFESMGNLGKASLQDLMSIYGIKEVKAIELQAAFEIGRRIAYDKVQERVKIESPDDLISWLSQAIGYEKQEHFIVAFLNQRNQVISSKTLFVGTLTNASVHPREIFKEAMRIGCAKIICAHNHPSGDASASEADIAITRSINECGKIVSIPLLDHIIVSGNTFLSFRQKRLID